MTCLVADSGPLIALAKLGLLDLPVRLFTRVVLPSTVFAECLAQARRPDAQAIKTFVEGGQLDVVDDAAWPEGIAVPRLDAGETAALALAHQLQAHLLVDELRGRRAARRLGVPVVGVCGLLLLAKRQGYIDAVAVPMDVLRAQGYFIAPDLRSAVLAAAGED
jgi:predicted nucleic acid-binding protein